MLAVEPYITHEHNTLKVEHYPSALPFCLWGEHISIPSHVHFLETTRTQSAAHITACITIVRTFRGIWFHPRLSDKEVMRKVHPLALSVFHSLNARQFTQVKLPSGIQAYRISHCGRRSTYEHCHSRQNHKFLHSKYSFIHLG